MKQTDLEALMQITECALNKKKPLSERGMVLSKNKGGGLTMILPASMKSTGMIKCVDKNREIIDEFKDDDSQKYLKL